MAFIDYLRRFFTFFRFKHSVVLVTSIALSVLFWLYAPLVAFNDIYSFASVSSRVSVLVAFWAVILFFVLLRPLMNYFASRKDEKNDKLQRPGFSFKSPYSSFPYFFASSKRPIFSPVICYFE